MKLLLATALLFTASSAFAKKATEYFFQPNAGQSAVELQYNLNEKPTKTETFGTTTSVDTKVKSSDVLLDYGYGLSESQTLGLKIGSGSVESTSGNRTTSTSGLTDPRFYYEQYSDIWHFGADLGVSLDKSKNDNRSSGGLSLGAHAGLLMNADAWNYGADLRIGYPLERTGETINTKRESKITGTMLTQLAAFTEYNLGMGFVGAELSYAMLGDTTTKVDGVSSKTKGESVTGLRVNGSYDFNEMWTGLASVGMLMHAARNVNDTAASDRAKAYNETDLLVGVRGTF